MSKSNKITEAALLTSAYIILLLISVYIPLIGTFTFFALPIPFIMYTAKYNWQPALMMFIAAGLLSFIFATLFSLPMTLLMAIGGIMIGTAIYEKKSAYETWARGAVGFVVGLIGVFLIIQFLFNINIYDEIDTVFAEMMNIMQTTSDQLGMGDELNEQLEPIAEQMDLLKDLIPASMAIISILMAFVAQWLSYKILNRIDRRSLYFPSFTSFNLPVSLIWLYFIALLLSFFVTDTESGIYIVVMNVVTLSMLLLMIQGFSFIFFYAEHKKLSKAIPIVIVIVTFLIPGIFFLLIRILGIIDLGYSLKKRIANKRT